MPAKDGFQLQDRDIELLDLTHQLGIATVAHFARHAERSYHVIYKRVAKLEEQRYLSRITKQPEKAIYQLGPEGAPVLIERGYAPQTIALRRMRGNELKPLGRAHALHIANIHASLIHETKSRPEKIILWRQDPALYDRASHRGTDGKEMIIPVRPDAYFVIEHHGLPQGKNQIHFFLEADRGTMSYEAMAQKIIGYLAYYEAQRFTRKYPGMRAFRVLVVTETRSRADGLRHGLRYLIPSTPLQRAYRFLALEDLNLSEIMPQREAKSVG